MGIGVGAWMVGVGKRGHGLMRLRTRAAAKKWGGDIA